MRFCKDITNLLLWVLWEPLIMLINDRSPCRKFWCPSCWNQLAGNFHVYLHAKKSNSSLTSFWDIVKDIEKLLFWKFCKCWPSPSKSKTFMLICMQKTDFITHFSSWRYRKEIAKLVILGNLGMPGHTHLKQ